MTADKRRTDACLKACEGISTQNLEDNVPFLELARRYNVVLRERDALRAKVEAMEKQEPVARFNWSKGKIEWLRPWNYSTMNMKPLYLAPGAKGE